MADDFNGCEEIFKTTPIWSVTDENNFTNHDLLPFIKISKITITQPDIMRGGYINLFHTSILANQYGIKIVPHIFPEISIYILASIKISSWLECMW